MSDQLSAQQKDFLETFLGVDLPDPGSVVGIVEKRKFLMTRWQQIKTDFDTEISALSAAIGARVPFEKPDEISAGVTAALAPFLDDIKTDIQDAVDHAVNTGDPKYSAVGAAIQSCRDRLGKNELISALRSNSLMPGDRFETAVSDALSEIHNKLTA